MAQARRKPEEEKPEEPRAHLRQVKPGEEEQRAHVREEAPPLSWLAIAGLGLSIFSLIMPVSVALITGTVGAILGGVALQQINRAERSGSGLAWGAIAVGVFVVIIAVIALFTGIAGTAG